MSTPGGSRFGILILQDAPFEELVARWQRAEELGFDTAYVADHTGDYRNLAGYWLDGWTVLAHVAARTTRIRVGTLVSNPLLRHPAQLARVAATLDCLSGGRLELGIGTGIAGFDHDAVGEAYWEPRERMARFAEYVQVVDGALRSPALSFRHEGTYFRTANLPLEPPPVQRPRPPIIVGGQSPTVLRTAARHADEWNTHGPFGRTIDEIADVTAEQNQRLDDLCRTEGREPLDVRRSLLLFESLDAWSSADAFETVVDRFRPLGIQDFVVFWPPADRTALLERAAESMERLRVHSR